VCAGSCVGRTSAHEERWLRRRVGGDDFRRTIPNQHRAAGHFVGCCRLPPRRKLKVPLCWMEVDRDRIGSGEANRFGMDAVAGAGKCGGSALIVERVLCVVFNWSR
jgi:hypothetical protein